MFLEIVDRMGGKKYIFFMIIEYKIEEAVSKDSLFFVI